MRGNARGLEVEKLQAVTTTKEILEMQDFAADVVIPEAVETYILDVVGATRSDPSLTLGASPRASITLAKASRVMAASDGRDTVYPEDVKVLLRPVIGHRLILTADATLRGETVDDVLERVVGRLKAPMGVTSPPPNGSAASRRAARTAAKAAEGS